ncbi:MAG: tetratricopeptide repeat protein [Chloroflexi bacterium]|nr:tetratricopeptide repeat protein [Chloroflexota bacterium]
MSRQARVRRADAGPLLAASVNDHQAGRFEEAERGYRSVLQVLPGQPDALHLLGVLALQRGKHAAAATLIRRAIAQQPGCAAFHSNLGVALQGLGHLEAARTSLERAVHLDGSHIDSLFNLGVTLQALGRDEDAIPLYRRVVALAPERAGAHQNLGNALQAQGEIAKAITSYLRALALAPDDVGVLGSLGVALTKDGRRDEALTCFDRVIALSPNDPAGHLNRAIALHGLRRFAEAVEAYRHVLAFQPTHLEARRSLARALQASGQIEACIPVYRQALTHAPTPGRPRAGVLSDLGAALREHGQPAEALACFEEAVACEPNVASHRTQCASLLSTLGRAAGAERFAREALALDPSDGPSWRALGTALRDLGRTDEAIEALQRAAEHAPSETGTYQELAGLLVDRGQIEPAQAVLEHAISLDGLSPTTWTALGGVHDLRGDPDAAVSAFSQALALRPDDGVRVRLATVLPTIARSGDEITEWRARWRREVERLLGEDLHLNDPLREVGTTGFYLAYHGLDDRPAQEQLARLYLQACPSLAWTAPHCRSDGSSRPERGRIRVGIISRYLADHTIGKFMRGLIQHLDRERFEVVVLQLGRTDVAAEQIAQSADRAVRLGGSLAAMRERIAEERLDVLFYADIGMDPATYFLAYARLAPVQCVTWGHPVTTGIPNVDAFLSAEALEPTGADAHYSERLVRLTRLPTCYARPAAPEHPADRSRFGLPDDARLYGCPQSLFKLHPDFDSVLVDILRRDPDGRLILVDGVSRAWSALVRERIERIAADVVERVLFLPRMPGHDFVDLLRMTDVLLDPIHFGGGNTSYEACAFGVPIVTMPGAFMRGRVTAACYRQMGVLDTVVASAEAYAACAVSLANDDARRQDVRARILAASGALYGDIAAVREIERYFEDAARAGGVIR